MFSSRSTKELVLGALPIVKKLAQFIPQKNYSQQFPDINYEAQICYGFTRKFCDKIAAPNVKMLPITPVQIYYEMINILTVPHDLAFDWIDFNTQMNSLHISLPTQNLHWNVFFSVLKSRFTWLQEYFTCI